MPRKTIRPCVVCGKGTLRDTRTLRPTCGGACLKKTKSENATNQPRTPVANRFWSYVNKSEGCWEWDAGLNKYGYGQFRAFGQITAHRVSYVLEHGSIPEGLFILHKCDNPKCVRPDHLYAGTHDDNMRDRAERMRTSSQTGEQNGQSKLTDEKVRDIFVRLGRGESQKAIASYMGVSPSLISYVKNRKVWSHVKA